MTAVETALIVLAAVGSAAVGGVFFAFDGFVLRALAQLPGTRGADAMRAINVTAVRPPLMVVLFGTAALAVAVVVLGAKTDDGVRAALLVGGGLAYLVGVIGTTIVRNVPLNNALDAERTAAMWERYLRSWSRANRVRTIAGLLCAVAVTVATGR